MGNSSQTGTKHSYRTHEPRAEIKYGSHSTWETSTGTRYTIRSPPPRNSSNDLSSGSSPEFHRIIVTRFFFGRYQHGSYIFFVCRSN